jgi:hypothetical protein
LIWVLHATSGEESWTGGSAAIMAMIIGGIFATGALTGALMWLAFYSSRKGYDQTPTFRTPSEDLW